MLLAVLPLSGEDGRCGCGPWLLRDRRVLPLSGGGGRVVGGKITLRGAVSIQWKAGRARGWRRLDRRTRSCVTLTALVAGGHLDELAMHVRAALRSGLTPEEIGEVLLQCAIYCGVPAANAAFAVAQRVLNDVADGAG
ncbi:hypothetical protein GCM10009560_58810 [Nonomuraea longicatena]|uniref:Carboxymuconolactone decarboxylase-like domain-containing protein n=1 Tax=Nonomuraea longicatena TaxID=83682 RepID=A0ABN1QMA0_9ACTN